MKAVYFRVDSSLLIGSGHVMRCLTLANELRNHGVAGKFICREHFGNLIEFIKENGFEVHSIPLSNKARDSSQDYVGIQEDGYRDWLGETWEKDAEQTLNSLGDTRIDCLIVDHYEIERRWEQALRRRVEKIIVIDDLADRDHDCDLLLDQNLGRHESNYLSKVPQNTTLLIGPKYALLRPEFAQLRVGSLSRRVQSSCEKITISMGGVDKNDETSKILQALSLCELSTEIEVDVVLGRSAVHANSVRNLLLNLPYKVNLHVGTSNMASILANCDLLIGAGGSTVWEACCLGLPSLLKILADNQERSVIQLNELGCAFMFDRSVPINVDLPKKMSRILESDQLEKMSRVCATLTDGLGAQLVAKKLLDLSADS